MKEFEVTIVLSSDRDDTFAEIAFGDNIIAEVAERPDGNLLTLFSSPVHEQCRCADFIAALQEAELRLARGPLASE